MIGSIVSRATTPAVLSASALSSLAGSWSYVGCYVDAVADRMLSGATNIQPNTMTEEFCLNYCHGLGFKYAGVEYHQECYCGDTIAIGAQAVTGGQCAMSCTGNTAELCGDSNRINIFENTAQITPTTPPTVGEWSSLGCFTDTPSARTLSLPRYDISPVTIESCTSACADAGYLLAGVEFGSECYCGDGYSNGGVPAASSGCDMACSGDSTEICGGSDRLNIYTINLSCTTSECTTPGSTGPITVQSTDAWTYLGCYTDNVSGRTLTMPRYDISPVTIEDCTMACEDKGYLLAGVEYGSECYCGYSFSNGGSLAASGCDMLCNGNHSEYCGGSNRMNIYTYDDSCTTTSCSSANLPETVPSTGDWTYVGCYIDTVNPRTLSRVGTTGDVTIESCTTACDAAGYSYAGAEYSSECYCGNSIATATVATDGRCNMTCQGDTNEFCGGAAGMDVYKLPTPTTTPVRF